MLIGFHMADRGMSLLFSWLILIFTANTTSETTVVRRPPRSTTNNLFHCPKMMLTDVFPAKKATLWPQLSCVL